MKIKIFNETNENIKEIKKLMRRIFSKIHDQQMQVVFVSLEEIHRLNLEFRNVDRPTDVLSFPNDDKDDKTLGDIFIALDQARAQAEQYGHSFEREVGFLAVHGYLHLKGYDHYTPEEEKAMIAEQERILKQAKLERN